MPLITFKLPGGKKPDVTDTPTDTQVLTFSSAKDQWDSQNAGGGGAGDFTTRIHLIPGVPQGVVAFPDIQALATASTKKTNQTLPDGASVSIYNFYCDVPNDLASTPAASIKFKIIGLGTGTSDNVRLTVSTGAFADAESIDQALTAETEATVPIPDTAEVQEYYDQDMTTDPTAGDMLIVQIQRDPTDGDDDYAANMAVVGAYLEIDRTTT